LGATQFPAIETPLIEGDIAFRQHGQGHTPGPNWPAFLRFAGRYLETNKESGTASAIAAYPAAEGWR
jgi:hypothetical protein